ncbi:MAG: hypothetical protein GYA50_01855 [Eubacteriaceae bacterium]|nr:hypothetical protein [Eubacteriaceae bacterium]
MFKDVELKIKKRNQILFSRDSLCLQDLSALISDQTHRTLVMWALNCGNIVVDEIEQKYPYETRPKNALELCKLWARGEVKMPAAKRAILDCHAAAKELSDPAYSALCHAVGHAGASVHVETHAIGLPIYELTAIVIKNCYKDYENDVTKKIDFYIQRLIYWQKNIGNINMKWAGFLKDDN